MTIGRSLLPRIARLFGFDGTPVVIDLPEGPVAVTVTMDEAEHSRRGASGLGAIPDRQLLTALWELPHALSVPTERIPGWASARLSRAALPVVAADDDLLTRVVCPPLVLSGALAVGRNLDRPLRRVGQVSAIAPMAVVGQHRVDVDDPVLLEAALYGVGVGCSTSGALTRILDPEPVIPMPGPFLWWIAELAYQRMIDGSATGAPMLPPAA